MSTNLVDLGYVRFQLNDGWIARSRLDIDVAKVGLVRGNAICELTFLSSGSIHREKNLEILYQRVSREAQSRGHHFDDLSEEFNYELISEFESQGEYQFQHVFVRLYGDVLVLATMTGYEPRDENEVRHMLETMESGTERVSTEAFSLLPALSAKYDWNRVGDFVFFNGLA